MPVHVRQTSFVTADSCYGHVIRGIQSSLKVAVSGAAVNYFSTVSDTILVQMCDKEEENILEEQAYI